MANDLLLLRTIKRNDGSWEAWLAADTKIKTTGLNQSEAVGRLILAKARHVDRLVKVQRMRRKPRG